MFDQSARSALTLAGLVAITAPSGFVGTPAGFIILIAGVLVYVSVEVHDRMQIDDPVGANRGVRRTCLS
jgi:ammonia channel protein AmtB